MPLNYTAFSAGWQGFFPYFLYFSGNISKDEDSFPPFSGKDTVYFLEIIRYNYENGGQCPQTKRARLSRYRNTNGYRSVSFCFSFDYIPFFEVQPI